MQPRPTMSLIVLLLLGLLLLGSTSFAEDNVRDQRWVGDPAFLETGDWWNLYFSERNDPLRRSVKAVKVLHVSKEHRGWVLIAVPRSREEHTSIFGPAAKAHDDDSVDMREALAKWEKSVTEWKTVWVNLDFVVSASRVAKNSAAEDHGNRSKR